MVLKTSFLPVQQYSSSIVMAFDDPQYSSSKLNKLQLGTYHKKEELKQRGFTFDISSKKWIKNKPFNENLSQFGIVVDDPIFILSPFWSGDLPPLSAEIRRKGNIREETIIQEIYHDPKENITYYDIVLCNDRTMADMTEKKTDLEQRIQKIDQNLIYQESTDHMKNKRKTEIQNQLSVVQDALQFCQTLKK